MAPDAPFVQFTYAMVPPIPMRPAGVSAQASELIWQNLPPARVWVYRRTGERPASRHRRAGRRPIDLVVRCFLDAACSRGMTEAMR